MSEIHAPSLEERAQALMNAADNISYNDAVTILDHTGMRMDGWVAVREQQILDLDAAVEELRPLVEAAALRSTSEKEGNIGDT